MSDYKFSIIADYITESGHYDAHQTLKAPDGIVAAILFLQNVRDRIEARETVTNIVLRITIQIPESRADSSQGRPQESDDGPGA